MGYRIVKLTNQSPEFYPLMGPFLSRRVIIKELGFPLWDEDEKEWFVALEKKGVVGFGAIRTSPKGKILCSAYVLPDKRKQGVYTALLDARLKEIEGSAISTINPVLKGLFLKRGFKQTSQKGHFLHMRKGE